jgi:REP element-mobilizing transposase RayT
MVLYRRNFVPNGTFFFTATLADRRSCGLVENISLLRHAFRVTRHERPFSVDAVLVLPDHLHIVMTLPLDDADFRGVGSAARVCSRASSPNVAAPDREIHAANMASGSVVTGSTPSVMSRTWCAI